MRTTLLVLLLLGLALVGPLAPTASAHYCFTTPCDHGWKGTVIHVLDAANALKCSVERTLLGSCPI